MNANSPGPSSPGRDWAAAEAYVLSSLPAHAARAGMIDELLLADGFLLHGDLVRLLAAADQARTAPGRERALLVSLTPAAVGAGPAERAALFSVTAAMEGIAGLSEPNSAGPPPYRAAWAATRPRSETAVLDGGIDRATGVCTFDGDDGRPRLATVGYEIQRGLGG
ncbi:hypothetical protein L3Q67_25515 [Saccharothrix sp. AJ9571]|nr:hypothetical protein L3Q67_25515 [Saccharothrix sp. AJ9571]